MGTNFAPLSHASAFSYTRPDLAPVFRFSEQDTLTGRVILPLDAARPPGPFSKGAVDDVGRYHAYLPRLRSGFYVH
jgi:hypothetical protein